MDFANLLQILSKFCSENYYFISFSKLSSKILNKFFKIRKCITDYYVILNKILSILSSRQFSHKIMIFLL